MRNIRTEVYISTIRSTSKSPGMVDINAIARCIYDHDVLHTVTESVPIDELSKGTNNTMFKVQERCRNELMLVELI